MYKIIGADGKAYGPVSADQLRQWIAQGRVNGQTLTAAGGMSEWKPLGTFAEFAFQFAGSIAQSTPAVLSAAPVRGTNGFAIVSMVMGILSLVVLCCCYGLPFNVLGIIFGIIALVQIRGNPQRYEGTGMAIAGLVLSVVSILLALVLFVFMGIASGLGGLMNAG